MKQHVRERERKERTQLSSSPSPSDLTSEPTINFSLPLSLSSSPPSITVMPQAAVNSSFFLHNLSFSNLMNLIWNEFQDSFSYILISRLICDFLKETDNICCEKISEITLTLFEFEIDCWIVIVKKRIETQQAAVNDKKCINMLSKKIRNA